MIAVHCNKRQGYLLFISGRLKEIVSSLIIQSLIISVLLCLFIAEISISCVVYVSLSVIFDNPVFDYHFLVVLVYCAQYPYL